MGTPCIGADGATPHGRRHRPPKDHGAGPAPHHSAPPCPTATRSEPRAEQPGHSRGGGGGEICPRMRRNMHACACACACGVGPPVLCPRCPTCNFALSCHMVSRKLRPHNGSGHGPGAELLTFAPFFRPMWPTVGRACPKLAPLTNRQPRRAKATSPRREADADAQLRDRHHAVSSPRCAGCSAGERTGGKALGETYAPRRQGTHVASSRTPTATQHSRCCGARKWPTENVTRDMNRSILHHREGMNLCALRHHSPNIPMPSRRKNLSGRASRGKSASSQAPTGTTPSVALWSLVYRSDLQRRLGASRPSEATPPRRAKQIAPTLVKIRAQNGLFAPGAAIIGSDSDENRRNLRSACFRGSRRAQASLVVRSMDKAKERDGGGVVKRSFKKTPPCLLTPGS